MSLSLVQKSVIYILALIPVFAVNFIAPLTRVVPIILAAQGLALVVHLWMSYVIYNDAPERGLNENWYLPQVLLGPIGLALYGLRIKMKS